MGLISPLNGVYYGYHIAGKPEALAECFSSISTVGGNKIMRKDDSAASQ